MGSCAAINLRHVANRTACNITRYELSYSPRKFHQKISPVEIRVNQIIDFQLTWCFRIRSVVLSTESIFGDILKDNYALALALAW